MLGFGFGLSKPMPPAGGLTALFRPGDQGLILDPAARTKLFQDSAGTVAVTAAGQPVGMMADSSACGNHATQATSAKRPTWQQDAGGRDHLAFDGVDDLLATGDVGWGTDTVTVVVAQARLALNSNVMEMGTSVNGVTGVSIFNTTGAAYRAASRGTVTALAVGAGPYSSPDTAVLTLRASISGDYVEMRRNAVSQAVSADDQGSGTYGTRPVYLGGRANGTLVFSGRVYGLFVISRLLSDAELALAEGWMATKCGVVM